MSDERDTTPIDDTVIEALRPQARRYDVAIDEDMVLSVLPNGVKTWTWVYDNPADPHRKTLGIYPDMSLEDAKKSLAAEKAAYRRALGEKQAREFVIRDGRIQPATLSSSNLLIIGGGIAAVIAVVFATWVLLGKDDAGETPLAGAPSTTVNTRPGEKPTTPSPSRDAARTPAETAATPAAIQASPADGDAAETAAITMATDDISAELEIQVASINERLEAELDRLKSLEQTDPIPDFDAGSTAGEQRTNAQATASATPLPYDRRPETSVAATGSTAPSTTAPSTTAPATAGRSTPAPATTPRPEPEAPPSAAPATGDTPARAIEPDPAAFGAEAAAGVADNPGPTDLLLDGRVARGLLTTAVVQREPVDDLGSNIVGSGEELQTFYFYTELRKLSGQRIRHRWVQGDRVIAEVPFNVGEAWRWRVFSSKTFLRSMAGSWRVQVVLDDDTVIYNLPFVYTP